MISSQVVSCKSMISPYSVKYGPSKHAYRMSEPEAQAWTRVSDSPHLAGWNDIDVVPLRRWGLESSPAATIPVTVHPRSNRWKDEEKVRNIVYRNYIS